MEQTGSKIISEHLELLRATSMASRNVPDVPKLDLHVPVLAMERFTRIVVDPRTFAGNTTGLDRQLTEAYGLATGVETSQTLVLPIDSLGTDFQHHDCGRKQKFRPKDVCSSLLMDDLERMWDEQPTDRWLEADAKEQLQLSVIGLLEAALASRILDDGLDEVAETLRNTATLIGLLLITARIRAQDNLVRKLSGLECLLGQGILPIGHMAMSESKPPRSSVALPICVAVSFTG